MKNDAISTKISIHLAYPKETDKAMYRKNYYIFQFQHQNGIEILKSKYINSSFYQIGYFLANVLYKLEYIFDTEWPILYVLFSRQLAV